MSGLAIAIGLVAGWSTAEAAPARGASRHKKPRRAVVVAPPAPAPADDAEDADRAGGAAERTEEKRVALSTGDAEQDEGQVAKRAAAPAHRDWQVAIGPYLWASSVSADVSLGGGVSSGIDIGFIPLERHARYGAEILADVRYRRFAVSADFMYGVAAVTGSTEIASLMVTLTGNASSLLVDGAASYQVIGDDDAVFSLEARAGVRYQRTEITGEVNVAGYGFETPSSLDAGSDALVGTRAVVRPARWFFVSGLYDHGVFGASTSTWSASADASLRVSSHVLISAGWRTLTMQRERVSLSLQGPRAAVQLVF